MNFRKLLQKAKNGDKDAVEELIYMYQPLISKMSFIDCKNRRSAPACTVICSHRNGRVTHFIKSA